MNLKAGALPSIPPIYNVNYEYVSLLLTIIFACLG
jgi:hypothetical protein